MSWLRKEIEESARARANQSLHVRDSKKTRTLHDCFFCKHEIPIGSEAKAVTEEVMNQYTQRLIFTKPKYYHNHCFLQTYPDYKPKKETGAVT